MNPTKDLIAASRPSEPSSSITTSPTSRECRHPTPADWERWAPTISARYKRGPARLLIQEMNANGLLVTEKMFRDRLRQWGLNDKNRSDVARKRQATSNETTVALRSTPHPSKERPLQQALKRILDWQNHLHNSGVDSRDVLNHTRSFYGMFQNLSSALKFDRSNQSRCANATQMLHKASAAFQNHLEPIFTPIALLSSIRLILEILSRRGLDEWYRSTSEFLSQTMIETLSSTHPTLLLLQAFFADGMSLEGLALIYKVGSTIIRRVYDEMTAVDFRLDFISAALETYPLADFALYANASHDTSRRRRFSMRYDFTPHLPLQL
ncbi:hypothetical protein MBLNU13_g08679t1 [Cladosporium sp. NU13]